TCLLLPVIDQEKRLEYPSFPTTPRDLVRPVGGEAVFECSTAGTPEPEIKWYKDGRVLIATEGVRMTTEGNRHRLELRSVLRSDQGEYVCKATNLAGTKSCGAVLTVTADIAGLPPPPLISCILKDIRNTLVTQR
ncbi:unnamed protein product, partial [Candidula unifasciata]